MITYQNFNDIFSDNEIFTLTRYSGGSALHFHSAVEIIYIKSGSLSVNLNGFSVIAGSGDIVVVSPSTLHGFHKTTDSVDYYFLMISDEFLKRNELISDNSYFTPVIKSASLSEKYQEIIAEFEEKNDSYKTAILGLIISIFITLNRKFKVEKGGEFKEENKTTQMVRQAITYISERYKEKITVDEICKHLHFSKSYLSHAFKEITGYSIIEYVNLLKCHNAKALLLDGYTVGEVSIELGFSDVSYFTRAFKKTIGVLPSSVGKSK